MTVFAKDDQGRITLRTTRATCGIEANALTMWKRQYPLFPALWAEAGM